MSLSLFSDAVEMSMVLDNDNGHDIGIKDDNDDDEDDDNRRKIS